MANTEGTRATSGSSSSTSPEAHGVVRVMPEEAVRALGGGGGGGGQVVDTGTYFVDQGGPVLTHVRLVPIFWATSSLVRFRRSRAVFRSA